MFNDSTDLTLTSFFSGEDNLSLLPDNVRKKRIEDSDGYFRIFGELRNKMPVDPIHIIKMLEEAVGDSVHRYHPLLDCGQVEDEEFGWCVWYSEFFESTHHKIDNLFANADMCMRCGVTLNPLTRFDHQDSLCDACNDEITRRPVNIFL